MNVTMDTIVRTALLLLALINQLLSAAGVAVLPIEDSQLESLITTAATIAASLWSWWKNNSFTRAACLADQELRRLKEAGL
ncbi:MAG: phage holin [Oscillospiraceae bacterium]|nr:phage holin [Oscillospiraceae bacterium]